MAGQYGARESNSEFEKPRDERAAISRVRGGMKSQNEIRGEVSFVTYLPLSLGPVGPGAVSLSARVHRLGSGSSRVCIYCKSCDTWPSQIEYLMSSRAAPRQRGAYLTASIAASLAKWNITIRGRERERQTCGIYTARLQFTGPRAA